MNKSSPKSSKSSAKPRSVAAKKTVKAKTSRRTNGSKSARSVPKAASKPAAAKAPVKSMSETAHSIAVAMKAAKVSAKTAQPSPVKARMIVSPTVQPYASEDILVKTHKFQVGQLVYYSAPTFGRTPAKGDFTVVKLLPSEGDEQQYRIKSNGEAFERVAKESQLDVT